MLVPTLFATFFLPLPPDVPKAIDFSRVPHTIKREPTYVSAPRYGLFLFGEDAEHQVWAVLDKSRADGDVYDVLYLDRDADGVLGEKGERISAKVDGERAVFTVGDLTQPRAVSDSDLDVEVTVHTDFRITWTKDSVRFRMMWKGETKTMGGYGPTRDTYAGFGKTAKEATVYVPGYDRPLEFEHWMSGTMGIGRSNTFKVFVGARGSQRGAFSCGDQKLLPEGECVLATLIYTDEDDLEKRVQCKLRERC